MAAGAERPGRPEFRVREMSEDDLPRVLDLMSASLGEGGGAGRTEGMWRWKHMDSPFGRSHVLVAEAPGGRLAGLRAFMRWEFVHEGRRVCAVRAVDTATHPDFQRMGLFSTLTRRAVDDVRGQGVGLVFNTPNEKSRPGYLKMGWVDVGLVAPVVRVLSRPRFALGAVRARLGRGGAAQAAVSHYRDGGSSVPAADAAGDARMGDLLEADAGRRGGALRTARTPGYISWRYGRHPFIGYRAHMVQAGGVLEACAITRSAIRHGMREVVMPEMLLARPERGLVRELADAVRADVRADYIVAYFPEGSFHREALRGSGFRRLPGQGMRLTANHLTDPPQAPGGLAGWGLSLGDLELF